MRRLALLLAASGFVLGACTHGGGDEEGVEPIDTRKTGHATPTPHEPEVPYGDEGARTMTHVVEAAGRGNAPAMWKLLSKSTRKRLGPTQNEFRAGAAQGFREGVGSFARAGRYKLILAEPINLDWGVAAITGRPKVEGRREFAAYAAALRAEDGTWKLELGAPVRLRPLSPDPGATKKQHPLLAVEISSKAAIAEGGLWLDGTAFPAEGGGSDARHFTIFGEPGNALRRGRHSVVAFGIAGKHATATAWTFRVGK